MVKFNKETSVDAIIIIFYMVLLGIVMVYHEPWFDESQAWLIARDSSAYEMVWHVMRYEGHTPLWHLLLYIPAHLGVGFELGLKFVNFVVITTAAVIFIRKSPFPMALRLSLPFTYFLFYQHGVISRNYSLFTLILWLIAAVFPNRNKKPLVFTLLLILLGGVSAYGILIAFGIAVAWVMEILIYHKRTAGTYLQAAVLTVKDNRVFSLLLLAAVHLVYVAILWPTPDRHTPPLHYTYTVGERIYRLLIAPVGALFISESPDFWAVSPFTYLFACAAGLLLIVAFIVWTLQRGTFPYAVLPYLCVTIFMSFVYFSLHHTGIYLLLFIFGAWISLTGKGPAAVPKWAADLCQTVSNAVCGRKFMRKLASVCVLCILINQLYWSAAATVNDIKLPYAPYRELAAFIQENQITGRRIFDYYSVSNNYNTYFTRHLGVLSYFSENIFYNHNLGRKNRSYAAHRRISDDLLVTYLMDTDKPEFIIASHQPLPIYKSLFSPSDYVPVASFDSFYMWKNMTRPGSFSLYIQKDLLPEFPQLKVQDLPPLPIEQETEDEKF